MDQPIDVDYVPTWNELSRAIDRLANAEYQLGKQFNALNVTERIEAYSDLNVILFQMQVNSMFLHQKGELYERINSLSPVGYSGPGDPGTAQGVESATRV